MGMLFTSVMKLLEFLDPIAGAAEPPRMIASGTICMSATEIMNPAATAMSVSSACMLRFRPPATASAPATFPSAESRAYISGVIA
jgi:hypothetical protein